MTWFNWATGEPDNKDMDQTNADCVYVSCCMSGACKKTGVYIYPLNRNIHL